MKYATWLIAIATVVYASLVLATLYWYRRSDIARLKPNLGITLPKIGDYGTFPGDIRFRLKNHGLGPAVDIQIVCNSDLGPFVDRGYTSAIGAGVESEVVLEWDRPFYPPRTEYDDGISVTVEYASVYEERFEIKLAFEVKGEAPGTIIFKRATKRKVKKARFFI